MLDEANDRSNPRFVLEGTETRWRLRLEGAREIRDRVGAPIFDGFLKCFIGLERLTTLIDLLLLTQQALPENSIRRRRNTRLIVVFTQSALVEIAEALDELNAARIVFAMNTRTLWQPLEAKRKAWLNDQRLRLVRNGVGHHLGHAKDFCAGINNLLDQSDDLVFAVGEGRRRIDDEQQLAWNALLRGLGHDAKFLAGRGMEDADHAHVVSLSLAAQKEFAEELWSAWSDVLARAGVACERVDAAVEGRLEGLAGI